MGELGGRTTAAVREVGVGVARKDAQRPRQRSLAYFSRLGGAHRRGHCGSPPEPGMGISLVTDGIKKSPPQEKEGGFVRRQPSRLPSSLMMPRRRGYPRGQTGARCHCRRSTDRNQREEFPSPPAGSTPDLPGVHPSLLNAFPLRRSRLCSSGRVGVKPAGGEADHQASGKVRPKRPTPHDQAPIERRCTTGTLGRGGQREGRGPPATSTGEAPRPPSGAPTLERGSENESKVVDYLVPHRRSRVRQP